jgi:hypothetical protein
MLKVGAGAWAQPSPSLFQGCQIVLDTIYQNGEKYTKLELNYQNGYKIYQMSIKIPNE